MSFDFPLAFLDGQISYTVLTEGGGCPLTVVNEFLRSISRRKPVLENILKSASIRLREVLFAVIIIVIAFCAPSKEKSKFISSLSASTPLEWIDDCPKSAPVCPPSYEDIPPLLLVSLDGFRPDYLKRGLSPTLARLSQCGVRAPYMMSVFPTKTFPNHFSQVTGLYPPSHGIIDNFMIDPETGKVFKLSSNSTMEPFWWEKEPIWVSAEKQGKKSATYFWPGSDVEINGTRPSYYREYNGSIPFEIRVDQVLEWLDLPLSERPSFLTLYISDVDSSAHEYGIHSQQVNESLSLVDKVIERLFSGLQQRNLTNCVNVFIVSDHGMADIDCSRSINLGKYVDLSCVRSTEGSVGRLQLTDCPNTTLEQVVKDIRCRNEHMRVYRKELLPVRAHYVNHPRIEPIFLDLDSGWTLLRWLNGREPDDHHIDQGNKSSGKNKNPSEENEDDYNIQTVTVEGVATQLEDGSVNGTGKEELK
ncbi:hypothetical protein TNCV_3593881 [Trichonephila clavipes]|nr:hypothetical protein TNCV_3593881 [Trichonephila clavipes]